MFAVCFIDADMPRPTYSPTSQLLTLSSPPIPPCLHQAEQYAKENQATADYTTKIETCNRTLISLEKEKIKKRTVLQQQQTEPERIRANITMIDQVAKELENESSKLADEIKQKEIALSNILNDKKMAATQIEGLGVKLQRIMSDIKMKNDSLEDLKRSRDAEM